MKIQNENKHGMMIGYAVHQEGSVSEDQIAEMKQQVVDNLCDYIRKIANEHEDFFIIKHPGDPSDPISTETTVGAKIILPTVKDDELTANITATEENKND